MPKTVKLKDAETLPVGEYLTGRRKTGDYYDITRDLFYRNVPLREILIIRGPGPLPVGVDCAYYRADGCRVVRTWEITRIGRLMDQYAQEALARLQRLLTCKKCGLVLNSYFNRGIERLIVCERCHGTFE